MRSSAMRAVVGVAFLAAACGPDGKSTAPEVDPGRLEIVLTEAPAGAGGLVLRLEGEVVDSVVAIGSLRTWQRTVDGSRTTVLVTGDLQAGPILGFTSPDRNAAYSVELLDAAAGASAGYVPQSAQAFGLSIERP